MIGIIRELIKIRKQQKGKKKEAELEQYFNEKFEQRFTEVFDMRLVQRLMFLPEQELRDLIKAHRPGCHLTHKKAKKDKAIETVLVPVTSSQVKQIEDKLVSTAEIDNNTTNPTMSTEGCAHHSPPNLNVKGGI
jgi:hypothetical protein